MCIALYADHIPVKDHTSKIILALLSNIEMLWFLLFGCLFLVAWLIGWLVSCMFVCMVSWLDGCYDFYF